MRELGPNQQAWVVALESGRFRQCRYKLAHGDGGYCCLGVAGAINGLEVGTDDPSMYRKIRDLLGLRSDDGAILGGTSFSAVNDCLGYGFNTIASFIRENPELCFVESK